MRVLVAQMYGLGNAVLCTPLCSALKQLGHKIDVLVECGRAAKLVFLDWPDVIDNVWEGTAPADIRYDIALFCHDAKPYLERAKFARHDDLRIPKPYHPRGYMWSFEKHELEYVMDMARRLGFRGEFPLARVPLAATAPAVPKSSVAFGIGYLKDNVAWAAKHWGNLSYAELALRLYADGFTPILVGGPDDVANATEIERTASIVLNTCGKLAFPQTASLIKQCSAYVGNDSGLMHVSAAVGTPTFGIFRMTNAVKNSPWCVDGFVLENPTVALVYTAVKNAPRSCST